MNNIKYNYIAISFTLKGQEVEKIAKVLENIASKVENPVLIHGFMPRELVVAKGWNTDALDSIEKNFPIRINLYDPNISQPMRQEMANMVFITGGSVHVIGQCVEGVALEVELYQSFGVQEFTYHPLEENA